MPRWLIVELPDGFPDPARRPVDFEVVTRAVAESVAQASGWLAVDGQSVVVSYRRSPDPVAEALDAEGVHPS